MIQQSSRNSLMQFYALLAAMASAVMLGCGHSSGSSVGGKLLHKDGAPVAGARVLLRHTESGKSVYENTDSNGSFNFRNGVESGNYAVGIVEDRGDLERPSPPTISPKYRDPSTSGLAIEVKPSESNELNMKLDPP
jgi:hypothetical protein